MLPLNIKEPGFFDFEHLARHNWRWKLILWKSNTTPKKCLRHSSTAGLWRLLTRFLAKLALEPKAVWLCMTLRFKSPIAELYCSSSVSDNLVYSNQRGKAAWHFGIFWYLLQIPDSSLFIMLILSICISFEHTFEPNVPPNINSGFRMLTAPVGRVIINDQIFHLLVLPVGFSLQAIINDLRYQSEVEAKGLRPFRPFHVDRLHHRGIWHNCQNPAPWASRA